MAYCRLEWKAGNTVLCGLEREVCCDWIDMRLRLKLGRRSRSKAAGVYRGIKLLASMVSGEVVYGIGAGEVAGGGSTSAMVVGVLGEWSWSGMRSVCGV
jgi:hypothetical protein